MTIESPSPAHKPDAAGAARRSFLGRRSGKIVLGAGAALLLVGGVAVAQGARDGRMGGMGMGMGMMGPHSVERLCALDVNFVSQRMADGLTRRLKLTDAQKPALNDLRQAFATAANEAKPTVCADQAKPANAVQRLERAQKGMSAATTVLAAVKPKLEAFYAGLDDTQKQSFDKMGQRGPRGKMRGHDGDRHREGWHRGGEDGQRGGKEGPRRPDRG